MHEMVASEALPRHRDFVTKERKTMAAPCSGGLETTSGASFVDACEEAILGPEFFCRICQTAINGNMLA